MFKNMKIGMRLALSFSLLIILMIVIVVTGLTTIHKVNKELETIVTVENVRIQLANNMICNAREVALAVRGTLLLKYNNETGGKIQNMRDGWTECWKNYHKYFADIKELHEEDDTSTLNLLNKIESSGDSAQKLTAKAIEMGLTGKIHDATNYVFITAYPSVKKWIQHLDELV